MNKNSLWAKRIAWLYMGVSLLLIMSEITNAGPKNIAVLGFCTLNFLIGFFALTRLEKRNVDSLTLAKQIRRKGSLLYYRSTTFLGLVTQEHSIALSRISKLIVGNAYFVIILDGNGQALSFQTLEDEKQLTGFVNLLFTPQERDNIVIEYSSTMELA